MKSLLSFRLERVTPNFLVSLWESFGSREAIISDDRRFTYTDLKARVFRLANALKSLGLEPKDRCAELLYNGNEFFESFFACSLIGCPMPFLNWHMTSDELVHAIGTTRAKALILSTSSSRRSSPSGTASPRSGTSSSPAVKPPKGCFLTRSSWRTLLRKCPSAGSSWPLTPIRVAPRACPRTSTTSTA